MWQRVLGASSLVAVFAANTTKAGQQQDRYNDYYTKKDVHHTLINHHHNHFNIHPHYQFAFSRYGKAVHTEHKNFTKSKKSKSGKRHTERHYY